LCIYGKPLTIFLCKNIAKWQKNELLEFRFLNKPFIFDPLRPIINFSSRWWPFRHGSDLRNFETSGVLGWPKVCPMATLLLRWTD
jgi:hypothetical protein